MALATAAPEARAEDTVFSAEPDDREALRGVVSFVFAHRGEPVALVTADGASVPLPAVVLRILQRVTRLLERRQPVRIQPYRTTLTTTQAAELLGMSRTYLARLIERGELPAFKVGSHTRLDADDVLRFRARQREDFQEIMGQVAESGDDLLNG